MELIVTVAACALCVGLVSYFIHIDRQRHRAHEERMREADRFYHQLLTTQEEEQP